MSFLKKINILIFICIISQNINAQEEFIIEDIILKGLQRVDPGSIYGYYHLKLGIPSIQDPLQL